MDKRVSFLVGLGTLLALAPACGSNCLDDGLAWSQSLEQCNNASATDSNSDTDATTSTTSTSGATATTSASATATMGGTDSATESTGAPTQYCLDADMDGQGDPTMCVPSGGDIPPGYVPNGDDCDDSDPFTFTGAAEIEDPLACMTDADDDGWGEPNPKPGVVPGTDCDDEDAATYPGAAEIEDPDACMRDEDEDGWGDTSVPPGVDVGSDCYDTNAELNPSKVTMFSVLDNNQGDMGEVDLMSGVVTPFANVDLQGYQGGWSVISTAVNPADSVMFGTNSAQQRLVTFDYCAADAPTNLMPHNLTICGLAFHEDGTFYGIDGGNDELVTFNPATGEVTDSKPITLDGQPVNIQACGMAYDCVSTRLLVSDGAQSRILSIDPTDGTTTVVADINAGSWNSVGLEYDPVSKEVFTNNGTAFYRIKIDGSNDFVQLPNLSTGLNDLGFGPTCM